MSDQQPGQGNSGDAAAQAAAAAAAAAANGGGTGGEPWYPAEHKDYVTNKGWKTPAELLVSTINLEKLVGADKAGRTIVLPKDANDAEGTKAFRAKLGVPEKAEDYKLPVPEGQDPALAQYMSGVFHEVGIPREAAQKLTEKWNAHIEGIVKANAAEEQRVQTEGMNALKTEWGNDFAPNIEHAKRSVQQFAAAAGVSKEHMDSFVAAIDRSPQVAKLFSAIGKAIGEHGFAAGTGGGRFANSKQEIQKQIDALRDKRVANQVSEKDFHTEMGRLGPLLDSAA